MNRIVLLLMTLVVLSACSGGLETTSSTGGVDNADAGDGGTSSGANQGNDAPPPESAPSLVGQYTLSRVSRTSRTGEQIDSRVEDSDLQGRMDLGTDGNFFLSISLSSEPWALNLKGRYIESDTNLIQISAADCSGPVDATVQLDAAEGKKSLTMIFPEGFCDSDYGLTSVWSGANAAP